MEKTECENCGKKTDAVSSTGNKKKYCSRHCKDVDWQKKHGWQNSKKAYEEWIRRGSPRLGGVLECVLCGKEFERNSPKKKYCSESCCAAMCYFRKRYGRQWRLAIAKHGLAKSLAAFKKEVRE